MNDPHPPPARSLRIRADVALSRIHEGEPVVVLDARSQKGWSGSSVQIPHAIRIRPLLLQIDPEWEPEQFLLVY